MKREVAQRNFGAGANDERAPSFSVKQSHLGMIFSILSTSFLLCQTRHCHFHTETKINNQLQQKEYQITSSKMRNTAVLFSVASCILSYCPLTFARPNSGVSNDGASFDNEVFDYVVVGGGLAGLVVATRLSEDNSKTVAVIEAGQSEYGNNNILIPSGNVRCLSPVFPTKMVQSIDMICESTALCQFLEYRTRLAVSNDTTTWTCWSHNPLEPGQAPWRVFSH